MLMINDILDYSQISNGKLRLNYECFSLWDTIKDVTKLIKFQAKAKGLLFIVECNLKNAADYGKKALIRSDPNRLKQILLNLFGNALKFTMEGSIKISLESEDDKYIIKVRDTGMGIKQEDQPKLFQLFGKLDNNEKKDCINKFGVGLGLAISQSLVKILNENVEGAEIKVESEYGKGSCFYFPLLIKNQDGLAKENSVDIIEFNDGEMTENMQIIQRNCNHFHPKIPAEVKLNRVKRILVVDDDQINILVASNFLRSYSDYTFDTAINGLDAIDNIKNSALTGNYYDVILMDCNMPKLDGYETTKIIIDMISNKMIPKVSIIACTANASPLDYEVCFKSGMSDFISKPFSKADLREMIEKNTRNIY
jgi:CheY-like chemotaxis protein